MRRPDEKSTTQPSPDSPGSAGEKPSPDKPNAFASALFEELREREPEPAVPEAGNAGPWRVIELHGPREPLFACHAAGEAGPRLTFDAPDLASLAAAALALSGRPPRFRWQRAEDGRLHLLHDGQSVATAAREEECLPLDLTRLADLRAQPLPLARFLVSVPQDVLRRAGALVMEILREGR
jgi:hypothetical protein